MTERTGDRRHQKEERSINGVIITVFKDAKKRGKLRGTDIFSTHDELATKVRATQQALEEFRAKPKRVTNFTSAIEQNIAEKIAAGII